MKSVNICLSSELLAATERLEKSGLLTTVERNRCRWEHWYPSEESGVDVPRADLYALVSIAKEFIKGVA